MLNNNFFIGGLATDKSYQTKLEPIDGLSNLIHLRTFHLVEMTGIMTMDLILAGRRFMKLKALKFMLIK